MDLLLDHRRRANDLFIQARYRYLVNSLYGPERESVYCLLVGSYARHERTQDDERQPGMKGWSERHPRNSDVREGAKRVHADDVRQRFTTRTVQFCVCCRANPHGLFNALLDDRMRLAPPDVL